MANITITSSSQAIALPASRMPLSIRPATMGDIPFIDELQKAHTKQVGWMPRQQLEEKIGAGHVLVAESRVQKSEVRDQMLEDGDQSSAPVALTADLCPLTSLAVGYCIGRDQYMKRDDVGIIYQLNVVPGKRRMLVGAALVKAMFERAAYGCRLFCCWCAQDIEANRFWESLGFVPLAFRSGARGRGQKASARVHIFWQRRVRAEDTGPGGTPWWFPAQTTGGSIREDRLVLPIPPGMHWSDEMPRVLPEVGDERSEVRDQRSEVRSQSPAVGALTSDVCGSDLLRRGRRKKPVAQGSRYKLGGFRLLMKGETAAVGSAKQSKPPGEPRRKVKNDPKLVAKARELRDRWLEQVNERPMISCGKYDVSRRVEDRRPALPASQRLLAA